jgi:hypothetical protein
MLKIDQTYTLVKKHKDHTQFGWKKITIHDVYPCRIKTRREHNADFFYRLKIVFFPGKYWKDRTFKERLTTNWKHVHFFPGPKMQVYEYTATATCDGEFQTYFDWDAFEEEIMYDIYKLQKG